MSKVVMQFNGHDIEGDAATLADINNKLTQHAAMATVLRWAVSPYATATDVPLWVEEARAVLRRVQS